LKKEQGRLEPRKREGGNEWNHVYDRDPQSNTLIIYIVRAEMREQNCITDNIKVKKIREKGRMRTGKENPNPNLNPLALFSKSKSTAL